MQEMRYVGQDRGSRQLHAENPKLRVKGIGAMSFCIELSRAPIFNVPHFLHAKGLTDYNQLKILFLVPSFVQ